MIRATLSNRLAERMEVSTRSEQRLSTLNRHLALSKARDDLEGRSVVQVRKDTDFIKLRNICIVVVA